MKQKAKFLDHTRTTVNHETGEVLTTESSVVKMTGSEPSFIKMYLEDIRRLSGLSKGVFEVLVELLNYMSYDNKIIVNSSIKKDICYRLNIYKGDTREPYLNVVDQSIGKLVERQILFRDQPGVFKANPFLIAKGYWQDIKRIRLEITYDDDNGRYIKSDKE